MLLAVLTALTVQVVLDAGPLIPLDEAVRDGMRDLSATSGLSWLDGVMHAFADLGGPLPAGAVLVAAYVFAYRRTPDSRARLRAGAVTVGAAALVFLLVSGGKVVIGRPGPGEAEVLPGEWGFFPSGHTATSAVCFGTAALLLGAVLGPRGRRRAYGVAVSLCVLVGFALMWCDYHWLGDVLGAWSLVGIVLWSAARLLVPPARPEP
ncbi:phosphatase PAP2 family protein [Yinghuangia seranimata]|uniref:phosphatase PAP2 family protein n=1 Tax=Yinghuangia seranimata TaxID=408067 RepID=UPI00248AB8F2|nr:phosphatase PAP2 family protein [Yinghuangia seranimata]MDI2132765.1 phosphatase PAP2 family protein [Yinghuangia seranimata]